MRLMIHPAFGFEGDVVLQGYRTRTVLGADPGINDGPAPLFVIGAEVLVEVLAGTAVVLDEEHRAFGNLCVVVNEVRHLRGVDGFESLLLEVVHHLVEVFDGDVIGGHVRRVAFNAVKHDDHDDRPRCGIVRVPFVMEVLAGVLNIGVRDVQRVKPAGDKACR